MPPEDDVFPTEEQQLPAAVSPITNSPGYITESDHKEDLEEEDDEDPKEGPADYPADIDDDDEEDEESSRDDTDDEEEEEGEDEEEEHLAPADSADVNRLLAIPTPPPSPLTSYSSPQIPSPLLPTSLIDVGAPFGYRAAMTWLRAESPYTSHPLPLPPPIVLLRTRASMIMMRAVAPSTYILAPRSEILPSKTPPSGTPPLLPIPLPTSSPPLLLPSTDCRADVLEVMLPPWKRLCIALDPRFKVRKCSSAPTARPTGGFRADYGFVSTLDAEITRDPDREIGYGITDVWEDPYEITEEILVTDVTEFGQRMTDFVTTGRHDTDEIYRILDDAQDDRLLMRGQLNLLRRDRCSHARTAKLMKSEARDSREAWVQSLEASDTERSKTQMVALQSQQRPTRDPTHPDVPEEAATTTTTTPVTNAQLKAMIDQGIGNELAARDADRSQNGDDSHNSGTGSRRIERTARECTYTDFLKC
uniref:Reverse transcriptase domain-containing protein n=1 Tax=Tanacetum cinerariifolium TaxID=118510 RepID=A0A6L2MQM5_TANCI|nr:hypothetical protein [Tanacetum cinerariifolium]